MRNEITLSDQMGAMAIVDGLRHRELLVSEHLDLHQRRAELSQKLRSYYQQQGIAATDELIDRGVREHFSKRLSFEAPKLSLSTRLVFTLMSNRKGLMKGLARGALIAAVLGAAGGVLNVGYHHYQVASVEDLSAQADFGVKQLRGEAVLQREQINALTATHNPQDVSAAAPLLAEILDRLQQVNQKLDFRLPESIDQSNYVATEATINGYNGQFMEAKRLLWRNREALTAVSDIYSASDSYHQLIGTQSFKDGLLRYPSLAVMSEEANQALKAADAGGAQVAKAKIEALRSSLSQLMSSDILTDKTAALESTYAKMGLSAKDNATVQALISSARSAIKSLNVDKAREEVDLLTGMVPFAQQELSIDIVSQGQSGVERTFYPGGAKGSMSESSKSWFAIAQATDAGGNVLKAPITDAYSGNRLMSAKFGVRISHEEYLRLKADKADGQIDDAHIGDKPANSLSIKWAPRVLSSNPSTISNW